MAQKNLLPFILLGLIHMNPMTGYDLKKEFETEIGEFWSARHSQIYLELKRMVDAGEIRADKGFFGNKIEKTYYEITELGTRHLMEWLDSGGDLLQVSKDEFVLKLYFIQSRNDPRLVELLCEQLRLRKLKLEHLLDRKAAVFGNQKAIQNHYGHYLILEHAIRRESEYVSWLKEVIEKRFCEQ
jgi:DNA-binding PadR family transcriptional regulator